MGLVALVIAGGALILIGHRPAPRMHQELTPRPTAAATGRVPTLTQLKANLAVLRRPQTAADRSGAQYICHACGARVLPGLTRLARTLPEGTKVFLSVWHLQIAEQGLPAGSYALHEDVIGGAPIIDPGSLRDTTFAAGSDYTVMPSAIEIQRRAPVWTAIVPDGVTSVRWTFACPSALRNDCRQQGRLAPVTVDASVIANIAGAQVAGTGERGAAIRVPTHADWYTGHRYQVASFSSSEKLTRAPFFTPRLTFQPHIHRKVLGYKHTPAQLAAERAASARAYLRKTARIPVDAALVKTFRLLRQAHTANAASQITVAAALSGLAELGATHGANPSRAGETTVGSAKDDVWLVPGSTGACLVDVEGPPGAGSGCNSTSAVDAGELWTLDTIPYDASGARTKVLLGAVPNGNTSVTVTWAHGGTTVVPVTDNVYSVPIGSHTGWKTVMLKNSAGTIVTVPGMPRLP